MCILEEVMPAIDLLVRAEASDVYTGMLSPGLRDLGIFRQSSNDARRGIDRLRQHIDQVVLKERAAAAIGELSVQVLIVEPGFGKKSRTGHGHAGESSTA